MSANLRTSTRCEELQDTPCIVAHDAQRCAHAGQQSRGCTHVTCCCPTSHSDRCLPERWGCGRWCQNSPAPASGGRSSQPAAVLQCQVLHSSTQAVGRTRQQAGQRCLGTASPAALPATTVSKLPETVAELHSTQRRSAGFQPLPVRQEQTARPAQRCQCPDGSACRSCSGRSFE